MQGVKDILKRPSGVRPVDPEEAARGKVDFIQVSTDIHHLGVDPPCAEPFTPSALFWLAPNGNIT